MTIQQTTDYGRFLLRPENRPIDKGNLAKILNSVRKHNMLAYMPIIVSEDNYVIDGQHRLQVAKKLETPIYYLVIKGADLQTIILLNTAMKRWTYADYLHAYVVLKNQHYIALDAFEKRYRKDGITLRVCISILAKAEISKNAFAEGKFVVTQSLDMAQEIVEFIIASRKYMAEFDFSLSRDYLRTVVRIYSKVDLHEIIRQLETHGMKLQAKGSIREYLRQFEDVLNFRKSKHILRIY